MARNHPLLTTSEVAERARVSPETVRRWVREGHLPAVTLPAGTLRFRVEDIDAMLSKAAAS